MRLGVLLDEGGIHAGRPDDPVTLVVLRHTLVNMPREGGARGLRRKLLSVHPEAELVPYAWHYVSHASRDGLAKLGSRKLTVPSDRPFLGEAAVEAWDATARCIRAFEGTRVVLRTPVGFGPGAASRARLSQFVSARSEFEFVWEPQGVWANEEVEAVAGELRISPLLAAMSATGRPEPTRPGTWVRVAGLADARLRSATAEVLAYELMSAEDESGVEKVVLFEGPRAHHNLRALARAAALNE